MRHISELGINFALTLAGLRPAGRRPDIKRPARKTILGLATGSSPKSLYAELVRLHREEKLSFKNVITFNLDEYYPIENDALQSYNRFMKEQLFYKVDIDPKNCHIPNGEWPKEDIKKHCIEYEKMIEDAG